MVWYLVFRLIGFWVSFCVAFRFLMDANLPSVIFIILVEPIVLTLAKIWHF